jgi:hypothetical protein
MLDRGTDSLPEVRSAILPATLDAVVVLHPQ